MSTVIRCEGYFDSRAGAMRGPADVAVEGRTLAAVHPVHPRRPAELDLSGAYLLPGLIDSHVHLSFGGDTTDVVADLEATSDSDLRRLVRERCAAAPRRGVTTVRDLGDRSYAAVDLGQRPGREEDPNLPTVTASGPPITTPGGHCHYLGGGANDGEHAVALVRKHAKRGVDWIKVMVTGGVLTSGDSPLDLQFLPDELLAMTNEAHRLGLPVAGHAHTSIGIEACHAAGFDTIEHCTFGTATHFGFEPQVADAVAAARIAVCPTYVERPGVDWDKARIEWRRKVLLELNARGVVLAAGTDAGVIAGLTHDSLPWAILSTCDAGVLPAAALRSATFLAARACRVDDRKGVIEAGMDADLVAVSGNPLFNPKVLLDPMVVMMRGSVVVG